MGFPRTLCRPDNKQRAGRSLGRTLRHRRALELQNVPDVLAMLDQYNFGATLLAPGTPAIGLLDRLPDWQRVYSDDVAVVHVRRGLR